MTAPKETTTVNPLEQLRVPFDAAVVGKLPRGGSGPEAQCNVCGGKHKQGAFHLDFVGHATVTDRLLTVDPHWNWEPLAFTEDGLPKFIVNQNGNPVGLWIKLTVCGVTRLGYGSTESGKAEAVKELIGDALRNAAMRFGVALDLWSKSELESQVDPERKPDVADPQRASGTPKKVAGPRSVREQARPDETPFMDTPGTLCDPRDLKTLQKDLAALDEEALMSITTEWREAKLPQVRSARVYDKDHYAAARALVDRAKAAQAERAETQPEYVPGEEPFTDESGGEAA